MRKTVLFVFILVAQYAYANVTLPKIFGDNMVLQREKPIPVGAGRSQVKKSRCNSTNKQKQVWQTRMVNGC